MSDSLERARSYVSKCPSAGQGGRNDALNKLAFALIENFDLSELDFESLLMGWASSCSPPINVGEAANTIRSAFHGANRKGVAGSKVRNYTFGGSQRPAAAQIQAPRSTATPTSSPRTKYHLSEQAELPNPLTDGTRALLKAAFQPGEAVRIAPATLTD